VPYRCQTRLLPIGAAKLLALLKEMLDWCDSIQYKQALI